MKKLTKYLLVHSLLLILNFTAFAQRPGTSDYLSVKNGFKIFKLGSPIKNYSQYIKLISSIDNRNKYEVIDPKFLTVGDNIKLDTIILTTIRGTLKEVTVVVDSMYKRQFLAVLRAAYGNHGIKYSVDLWIADNITLRYGPYNKSSKQVIGKSAAHFDDVNIR